MPRSLAAVPAHCADHGRYRAGCVPCRTTAARRNNLRRMGTVPQRVDGLGTARRLQALAALGWSGTMLADELGQGWRAVWEWRAGRGTVNPATAAKVAAVYDRLSMTIPEGRGATRARSDAHRKGWLPPLAWDDIDDPDEQPIGHLVCTTAGCARDAQPDGRCSGHQRRPHAPPSISPQDRAALVARIHELAEAGLTDPEIGRRVGKSADAVFKIRHRNTLGEKAS